jgi:Spy/CpxP family protein refolding chaperone
MTTRFSRHVRHAALASVLVAAFASVAAADPGPRGPMHGAYGGHPASVEQAIAHVKDKLALNAAQQAMFDAAVTSTKAGRLAGRGEMLRLREAMKDELAKPEPDLAALARLADDAQAKGQAERRKVRDEWLNLYGTFTSVQKQVVRDHLAQRMARFEAHRERMKERFGDKG